MTIGEKIREIRKRHRLSQDEFGQVITINGRLISRYENGRVNPSLPTLERVAKIFALPLEALTDDETHLPPPRPKAPDDPELAVRFAELARFSKEERAVALHVLDALILKRHQERGEQERSPDTRRRKKRQTR